MWNKYESQPCNNAKQDLDTVYTLSEYDKYKSTTDLHFMKRYKLNTYIYFLIHYKIDTLYLAYNKMLT